MDNIELAALLQRQEELLLTTAARTDAVVLHTLLAEDFVEFGSSGRTFDRAAIVELLAAEHAEVDASPAAQMAEFTFTRLANDVALVTYRVLRGEHASLRSSIWRERAGEWQIRFHQGTRTRAREPGHANQGTRTST